MLISISAMLTLKIELLALYIAAKLTLHSISLSCPAIHYREIQSHCKQTNSMILMCLLSLNCGRGTSSPKKVAWLEILGYIATQKKKTQIGPAAAAPEPQAMYAATVVPVNEPSASQKGFFNSVHSF
jgi:hypothetical protein